MNRGDRIVLLIESLAFGGDRIAHADDGRAVFVDGGAPGDVVVARLSDVKPRYARASVVALRTLGFAHSLPSCPIVDRCGGCPWQSVSLVAQRAAKYAIVERALHRVAPAAEIRPLVAPTGGFLYRSRARLTAGPSGALGYQARRSHDIVDVAACPLLEPALESAFAAARRALDGALAPGGTLAGLVGRGGHVQLALTGLHDQAARKRLLALLDGPVDAETDITGLILDGEHHGAATVDIALAGEPPFHAVADGFAQATHEGNRALRALVAGEVGGPHARILELFAGDGNFTRDLACASAEIVAVESDRSAAARLPMNVPGNVPGNVQSATPATDVKHHARISVFAEPAGEAAFRLVASGQRFDAVVLDPPRAGAPGLAPSLAALAPRIVYVSCDPMTLARDAAALVEQGFELVRATPLDLMPQTFHVETVCLFEKR